MISDISYLPRWNYLQYLISRIWWTRVWTIQELALATEALVLIGRIKVPLNTVETAFRAISPMHYDLAKRLNEGHRIGRVDGLVNWARPLSHMSIRRTYHQPKPVDERVHQMDKHKERTVSLWEVDRFVFFLTAAAATSCSDSRDIVYGLLGLCGDSVLEAIPIDYRVSADVVFTRAVVYLIQNLKTLAIASKQLFPSDKCSNGLPSWIPLKGESETAPVCRIYHGPDEGIRGRGLYTVLEDQAFQVTFSTDLRMLTVEGTQLDTIAKVSEPLKGFKWELLRAWIQLANLDHEGNEQYPFPCHGLPTNHEDNDGSAGEANTYVTKNEAFWRTIMADRFRGSRLTAGKVPGYRPFMLICSSPLPRVGGRFAEFPPDNSYESRRQVLRTIAFSTDPSDRVALNRRVFITKTGYMGLGPHQTQIGDVVSVVNQEPTPYILRARRLANQDRYSLVGECYVHGIMDGEVTEKSSKGLYQRQKFDII